MDIMIDIETLSQWPNAAIVSIGAVEFDMVSGELGREFYTSIDAISCKNVGLRIDESTVKWWMSQPKEARNAWMKNGIPIEDALRKLYTWIGDENLTVWAWGSNFDFPILDNAYMTLGLRIPWKYYNVRCARTVSKLFYEDIDRSSGTHHNALDDAKAQARHMIAFYRHISG